MIISGTLSVERKNEDRKIAKDAMFMMSQMDSIFSKPYIGITLILGILSHLCRNEVNGKGYNENHEKKRFKHI